MKMTCEKCGNEYEGHHRSKRCDACKGTAESLGSDIVEITFDTSANEGVEVIDVWHWREYSMCEGGYEVFPGWVWSQKKLVCVKGDAPIEVLDMMQDAFQRKVVNRKPVMGDADYGNKEKSL